MPDHDQLAALLPASFIAQAERINMPYLGYHLLRETLTRTLLGESESPILYWVGKNLGRNIPIQSAEGIILPFIRLGLGQLDLLESSPGRICYKLTHYIHGCMPEKRLSRTLALECGIIAGAVEKWQQKETAAQLEITAGKSVRILVQF